MFLACLIMLALGFPVAFTFGGVALLFGLYVEGLQLFMLVAYRTESIMTNVTLMAVPLFIFMGLILEKSGIAESMLESMESLFGQIRGGLAVSTWWSVCCFRELFEYFEYRICYFFFSMKINSPEVSDKDNSSLPV